LGLSTRVWYRCLSVRLAAFTKIQWIELKFCRMVAKAIEHMKANVYMLIRRGHRYGSKYQLFQFFKLNSETTSSHSLVFYIYYRHFLCFCTKSENQLLHGLFDGQSWQKWHIYTHLYKIMWTNSHAHKMLFVSTK